MLCLLRILGLVLVSQQILSAEIVFLISSQSNDYHHSLSVALRKDIVEQANALSANSIISVQILHEILNHPGGWTFLFVLPSLIRGDPLSDGDTKWIILCEETTHVNLEKLLNTLLTEDHTEAAYFGYPLRDREATIIHHFAFFENSKWFPYPLLRTGVIFSVPLLQRIAALLGPQAARLPRRIPDFSIDAAHELAVFIMANIQGTPHDDRGLVDASGNSGINAEEVPVRHINENNFEHNFHFHRRSKILLQRALYICPGDATISMQRFGNNCALYSSSKTAKECPSAKRQHIYFAIKTCRQFHKTRIPVLEATWAPLANYLTYFSDFGDANIPTIPTGVPNVETGHCSKTLAILKLAQQDIQRHNQYLNNEARIRWLFLGDDDTLLSIGSLIELLGCFNHSHSIYLGERYGYRLSSPNGFDYITGGGGIVLSLPVIELVLSHCHCPAPNSPDDMMLGACLQAQQITAIHSSRFHQARPVDYAPEVLLYEAPISFHKFWEADPVDIYEKWLSLADRQMLQNERLLQDMTCCANSSLTLQDCECGIQERRWQDLR